MINDNKANRLFFDDFSNSLNLAGSQKGRRPRLIDDHVFGMGNFKIDRTRKTDGFFQPRFIGALELGSLAFFTCSACIVPLWQNWNDNRRSCGFWFRHTKSLIFIGRRYVLTLEFRQINLLRDTETNYPADRSPHLRFQTEDAPANQIMIQMAQTGHGSESKNWSGVTVSRDHHAPA